MQTVHILKALFIFLVFMHDSQNVNDQEIYIMIQVIIKFNLRKLYELFQWTLILIHYKIPNNYGGKWGGGGIFRDSCPLFEDKHAVLNEKIDACEIQKMFTHY